MQNHQPYLQCSTSDWTRNAALPALPLGAQPAVLPAPLNAALSADSTAQPDSRQGRTAVPLSVAAVTPAIRQANSSRAASMFPTRPARPCQLLPRRRPSARQPRDGQRTVANWQRSGGEPPDIAAIAVLGPSRSRGSTGWTRRPARRCGFRPSPPRDPPERSADGGRGGAGRGAPLAAGELGLRPAAGGARGLRGSPLLELSPQPGGR